MSFVGHSPICTLSRSHTGLPAAKCAEALGAHPPGTGGVWGDGREKTWKVHEQSARPGRWHCPLSTAVALCGTLHTLPRPWWAVPTTSASLGSSPRGSALLSQPCPTKSTALSVLTKSQTHNHCHTALAQLGTGLAVCTQGFICGHTQGRYPHMCPSLEGWQLGDPGLWRGCHSPQRGLLGAGVPGECTVWPPAPG